VPTPVALALVALVLAAQAGTVYTVRHLVRKWCLEPINEAYRVGFDIGLEKGDQAGYDRAITDAIENPEAFTARLEEIRP
jgi:hypothetical protein